MRHLSFVVTLEEDAVISQHSGTAGGHRSLMWLPGAVFHGALARALPYTPGSEATWTIFHSGRVRCLPAFPLTEDGRPAMPMPRCFQRDKGTDEKRVWASTKHAVISLLRDPSGICNMADPRCARPPQPTQFKAAFLSRSGARVEGRQAVIPKTATHGGVARDQHLFAYQVIRAGSQFGLRVDVDDDVDAAVDAAVIQALTSGRVQVGRSRSAEFGSATLKEKNDADWRPPAPAASSADVVLYCHTDLLVLDPVSGQPTLTPRAEHFGLPADWVLDAGRSFVDTRRYAPFNAHRRRPDAERQVIVQGSTLVFSVPHGARVDVAEVAKALAGGVGAHRESGLGQVWVNPPFLMTSPPEFEAPPASDGDSAPATAPSPPDDPLVTWLAAARDEQLALREASAHAMAWSKAYDEHIPAAGGITRSQWALVRDEAARATTLEGLMTRLFGSGYAAAADAAAAAHGEADGDAKRRPRAKGMDGLLVAGVRGRKWGRSYRGKSPRDVLFGQLSATRGDGGTGDDRLVLRAVQILALRMPRVMKARGLGEER